MEKVSITEIQTEDITEQQFHILLNQDQAGRIIVRKQRGELLAIHGNLEYEVFPKFRGKQLAYKGCMQLADLLRANAPPNFSLTITANIENKPSLKTIEKLQAKEVGIIKLPNGEIRKRFLWFIK